MTAQCRACGNGELDVLMDFGQMPLAGGFLADAGSIVTEKLYPLRIDVCAACALVQIVDPINPSVLFDDYSFAASTVPGLVAHFQSYALWLAERLRPAVVVEFGCNDGVLLKPLAALGVRAVGVDLSKNIGEMARAAGCDVTTAGFTPEVAQEIRARVGPADVVTGSNAFAHNADPSTIINAANLLLRPGGRFCVEVMYAADLYEQLQWDTLYHEHLTFYGLAQLDHLLRAHGFAVEHAERISMHGGSLRVMAGRVGEVEPDGSVASMKSAEELLGITKAATWHDFATRSTRTIEVVAAVLGDLQSNRQIWGYGAAGKATMWVNACHLDFLEGMVDASPLRAGKLMPGTHTPIVLPESFRQSGTPGLVFVTAWNYLDAIRRNESWYKGMWATPLPSLSFV